MLAVWLCLQPPRETYSSTPRAYMDTGWMVCGEVWLGDGVVQVVTTCPVSSNILPMHAVQPRNQAMPGCRSHVTCPGIASYRIMKMAAALRICNRLWQFNTKVNLLVICYLKCLDNIGWASGRAWFSDWSEVQYLKRGPNDLHMVQLMPLPPYHLLLH